MSTSGVNFLIQQRDNLDELFRKAKTGEIDKSKVFKNNNGDFDSFSSSSTITGTMSSFTPGPNTTEQAPVQNVVYANNTQLYNLFECKLCKVNVIDTVFECGHCACALCCYQLSAACDNGSAGICHVCNNEIKDPRRMKNNITFNENNIVIN